MLVHWEVLFRHFIKSVSHAGQALGWHFVNNTWFGRILWNFKPLNVNLLVRAFYKKWGLCMPLPSPIRQFGDCLEFGFWIFCFQNFEFEILDLGAVGTSQKMNIAYKKHVLPQ